MSMTPMERRSRILKWMEEDAHCYNLTVEYRQEPERLEKLNWLPRFLYSRLWACPTLAHLIQGRILTIVCKKMRFPDE